jgi:hypothetical protein
LPPTDANVNVVPRTAFGVGSFARLDAEFVDSQILRRERAIADSGAIRLGKVVGSGNQKTASNPAVDASGSVDYVDIDSIDTDDGLPFSERISFAARPSRAKYVLQANDILVSNVRPVRAAVAFVSARNSGALASSGFTLIREPSAPPPATLFAYLRSRQLREQLVRRERGSMYPAVLERDVLDVLVPRLPDGLVHETESEVAGAVASQDAFFAHLEAMKTKLASFLKPYGSPPSPLESGKSGVDATAIPRSAAFGPAGAYRLDAEFFRSEYSDFSKLVAKLGPSFPLGRYYSLRTGQLRPGNESVPTVKQSALTNAGVNWSAIESRSGGCTGTQVMNGDILLASTAHEIAYVGRRVDYVTEVPDELKNCNQVVSEIIVLRPKADTRPSLGAYVAAFLRSASGRNQVQRCIRGLRGGHTYPQDLEREVIVPDPGDAWLAEFAAIAQGADSQRREAKARMQRAVERVELFNDSLISGVDWAAG